MMKNPGVSGPVTSTPSTLSFRLLRLVAWVLGWLVLGGVLTALAYQVPARHVVAVGVNDTAYAQGFEDATNRWGVVTDATGITTPYRWSGPESALIFPQIGLPADVTMRVRGWRPDGAEPPTVRVLLNGHDDLGSFRASQEWQTHTWRIESGLLKPRDLFVQFVVDPPLVHGERQRGVQVDQAILQTVGLPIMPYPAQVFGGALATLLAAVLLRDRWRLAVGVAVGGVVLFLLLYRLQVIPYPVRLFWPGVIVLLVGALMVRSIAAMAEPDWRVMTGAHMWRRLLDAGAAALIAVWVAATWWAGRAHVVLSVPGVEKDFRVFATRAEALVCPPGTLSPQAHCVLRADGFYQLGYPFLLWLARPFTADNPFLAGQVVALISGGLLLGATYLLGRLLLGHGAGLVALLFVLLNRWTAEYSLLLGTDMPFAAAVTLTLVALVRARRSGRWAFLAGLLAGVAFLIRHPGILLLPLGALFVLGSMYQRPAVGRHRRQIRMTLGLLMGGFALAVLPQVLVNVVQTGDPLYSRQAKNVWLAVYGNTDWGRWDEARDDLRLSDVLLHEPDRVLRNWWGNLRGFWGTGSEDTGEFGRGLATRLLTFPANLLAWGGLVLWLIRGDARQRFLLLQALVYVSSIAIGFMLPRFVLPLLPIWALMAATSVQWLWRAAHARGAGMLRLLGAGGCVALLVMAGAPAAGQSVVVANQDATSIAAVDMIRRVLPPGARFQARLPGEDMLAKYSAIAHLAADHDAEPGFMLVADPAPEQSGDLVGQAGIYRLYRNNP